jgi:hypothetical protein
VREDKISIPSRNKPRIIGAPSMSIRRRPAASIKGGAAQAKRWTDGNTQTQEARTITVRRRRKAHAPYQKISKPGLDAQRVGHPQEAAVRAWCQGATAAAPSARDGSHQEGRTHAHVVQLQSINTLHIVYTYAPEQDQGRATMEKLAIPNG